MRAPEERTRIYTYVLIVSIIVIFSSAFAAIYKVISESNIYLTGGSIQVSESTQEVKIYLYLYFQNPNIASQEIVGGYLRIYFNGDLIGIVPINKALSIPPKGSSTLILTYSLSLTNPASHKVIKGGSWYIIAHVKVHQPFGYYSKVFYYSFLSKPVK